MRHASTLLLLAGSLLLTSCAEADLPERSLQRDDCLREVRLDQLPAALVRCNKVVEAFPGDPLPRNERSVLLALSGDDPAACREIAAAVKLAQQAKPGTVDPMLRSELAIRQRSCLKGS